MLQRINDFLTAGNTLASLVLKLFLILLIILAIPYIGITIYGNIVENRPVSAMPTMPSIDKAPYIVTVSTTGQQFLSKTDVTPQGTVYLLKDFYTVRDNRWVLQRTILPLDSYYWGKITVERRVR